MKKKRPDKPDSKKEQSRKGERPGSGGKPGRRDAKPGGRDGKPGRRDSKAGGRDDRPGSRDDRSAKRGGKPSSRDERGRKKRAGGEREERPKSRTYSAKAKQSKSGPTSPNRTSQEPYLKDEIRINKYIAHAGFCSRREADEYIEAGKVKVNGKVADQLGMKVKKEDVVEVDGQRISLEPFVYILLNKGKDTISTTDDEKDRNTVLDAVEDATGYRVYPVGRLDRNTMGLLILTNDGDLAHRLMHPSFEVKKTYEVTASRNLTEEEVERLRNGVELEDGPVKPARVRHSLNDPKTIEITVFEGRNHLIRRMIAHLGADVKKLIRTRYAGLNDKDIRVGRWRYLKQKEINDLRKLTKLDTLDFNKEDG